MLFRSIFLHLIEGWALRRTAPLPLCFSHFDFGNLQVDIPTLLLSLIYSIARLGAYSTLIEPLLSSGVRLLQLEVTMCLMSPTSIQTVLCLA